jgi:hypothetical protein
MIYHYPVALQTRTKVAITVTKTADIKVTYRNQWTLSEKLTYANMNNNCTNNTKETGSRLYFADIFYLHFNNSATKSNYSYS